MKKIVRVNIPQNAAKLIVLALNILAKHLTDGASSILNLLNMADMQSKTDVANVQHKLSEKKSRDAETATEDRDLVLGTYRGGIKTGTVLYYITAVRDVLLGIYKANEHHLGDWGFEVNTSTAGLRVVIPTYAPDIIELAKNILAKHLADGASSPLNSLNMADMQSKTDTAETKHNLSKVLKQESEDATLKRDLALGHANEQNSYTPSTVLFYVSSARDLLLAVFRSDVRELSKWGFNVNTTLPSPTPPVPQATITLATNQTNPDKVVLGYKGVAGKIVDTAFGDGNEKSSTMDGINYVLAGNTYLTGGNYTITAEMEKSTLDGIVASGDMLTAVNHPDGLDAVEYDYSNNLLTSIFFLPTNTKAKKIDVSNNNLDQQSMDTMMMTANGWGTDNGYIKADGGTNAAPSGQGIAAMNQLLSRGWNVVTN